MDNLTALCVWHCCVVMVVACILQTVSLVTHVHDCVEEWKTVDSDGGMCGIYFLL